MGHWGVKSYENDDAADALDAGFDRTHGALYEELMADENPLTTEQVERRLANPETLTRAVEALVESVDRPFEEWDEVERLAFAGVVVRHAELGVLDAELSRLVLYRDLVWTAAGPVLRHDRYEVAAGPGAHARIASDLAQAVLDGARAAVAEAA